MSKQGQKMCLTTKAFPCLTKWQMTKWVCIPKYSMHSGNLRQLSIHWKAFCSVCFCLVNLTSLPMCGLINRRWQLTEYKWCVKSMIKKGIFGVGQLQKSMQEKTKKCDNMTLIFHLYAYKTFLYLSIICQIKINDFLSRQS